MMMTADALQNFMQDAFPQVAQDFKINNAEGSLWIEMMINSSHLRPGGTVSGPSMFCLADVTFYLAILREIGPQALSVTTNATINFMRKPEADNLMACPRLLKIGRSLVIGDVLIYSKSDISKTRAVAQATMTYSIPPKTPA